jgi:hypothetical protein
MTANTNSVVEPLAAQATDNLPRCVKIVEVIESRYAPGQRPALWNERREGLEKIRTADGKVLQLFSTGGQSTPAPGWELLLTKVVPQTQSGTTAAFQWTLYGVAAVAKK